ncbi:MarR family winged helix-turn-helix transcriptional regulator [Pseudomonas chlororaphis subsp. aurantiaca]|uniref:MarR family winged helix-turn-helix transcriptional regulator n=1 Tax=Pseudomonas chlororaphis TaxID=587753 RepID=UPI000F5808DE|nr:MarR family transcriptional regulator [Pseudomonas chlororaphis]AZD55440.1 Transcriptional regulator, MarR family [Pseudomonas chlororaphis subsp. aurantiaca]
MFELKDLPSRETLEHFGKLYDNPDVEGLYTWLVWASATDEMLSAFNANLARENLAQTPFFVLLLLKRNPGGLSIGALADGVAVASQTMTRAIKQMEAAGLCTKHPDPDDGRYWIVRLTPEGDSTLGRVLPKHYEWVARFMSHFKEDERELLVKLMMRVAPALRTMRLETELG